MMCGHARELMAARWQDEIDEAAESKLRQHLAACAECSAQMAALDPLWERLGDLPAPEPGLSLDVRWQATLDSLMRSGQGSGRASAGKKALHGWRPGDLWPRRPVWQMAIAMACLLIGIAAGRAWSPGLRKDDGEIAQLREEVASTREMVALSLLQQQSAAERLKGVDYSGRMQTMQPEVVSALIQAIDRDPSVNVRLAAIDALSKASGNRAVLESLTNSLARQDSPMVQAALVDYLADAHDRQAVGALRQLAAERDLNPAVLERANVALRELSH